MPNKVYNTSTKRKLVDLNPHIAIILYHDQFEFDAQKEARYYRVEKNLLERYEPEKSQSEMDELMEIETDTTPVLDSIEILSAYEASSRLSFSAQQFRQINDAINSLPRNKVNMTTHLQTWDF